MHTGSTIHHKTPKQNNNCAASRNRTTITTDPVRKPGSTQFIGQRRFISWNRIRCSSIDRRVLHTTVRGTVNSRTAHISQMRYFQSCLPQWISCSLVADKQICCQQVNGISKSNNPCNARQCCFSSTDTLQFKTYNCQQRNKISILLFIMYQTRHRQSAAWQFRGTCCLTRRYRWVAKDPKLLTRSKPNHYFTFLFT